MNYQLFCAGDDALASSNDLAFAASCVRAIGGDAQAAVLRFVAEHPEALLRTCGPGHLTGSALVVNPADETMLVLHHRKLRKWLQPGGHADGDANLAAVALKEATEETGLVGLRVAVPGIHLDIHLVEPPHEVPHLHFDVRYLVVAPPGSVAAGNHESTALRWVTLAELDDLTDEPGLRDLARCGLEALKTTSLAIVRANDRQG